MVYSVILSVVSKQDETHERVNERRPNTVAIGKRWPSRSDYPLEVINFWCWSGRIRMWIADHFFVHHCGIADFWRCASISHTVTGRFLTILGEMTHADKRMNTEHILGPIRHTPTSGLMQKFGFKSRITFWAWRSLCSVSALVIIATVTASLYNFHDRSVGLMAFGSWY